MSRPNVIHLRGAARPRGITGWTPRWASLWAAIGTAVRGLADAPAGFLADTCADPHALAASRRARHPSAARPDHVA